MEFDVSEQGTGQQKGGGEGSQKGAPDYAKQIREMSGQLESSKREAGSARQQAQALQEKFERMGQVFQPEQKGGEDSHDESVYDEILEAAFEAEKAGQPIPLTLKLALRSQENERALRDAMKEIKALKAQSRLATDPNVVHENQVFTHIDNTCQTMIEEIYGEDNPNIFRAVTSALSDEIKDLKKNHPEKWRKITLNPAIQKKMVQHFILQVVPPRARSIMHDQNMRERPFTRQDADEAFEEAKQIQDPRAREMAMTAARQAKLETMFSKRSR